MIDTRAFNSVGTIYSQIGSHHRRTSFKIQQVTENTPENDLTSTRRPLIQSAFIINRECL